MRKTAEKSIVVGIDVAKEEQFAVLMDSDETVHLVVKWNHLKETGVLIDHLCKLPVNSLVAAMEPTGVYGDTLRRQLSIAGYVTHQVGSKRVSDAAEIYDGVPSLHDAKSAYIVGRLYWNGVSQPWVESSTQQRELKAQCNIYEIHRDQYEKARNRLEAMLQRHWPELPAHLDLGSITLEYLVARYGCPKAMSNDLEGARRLIRKVSRGKLCQQKIDDVINGSQNSIGVPCVEEEVLYLQHLAMEMRRERLQQKASKKKLEAYVDADSRLKLMKDVVGNLTTAMLVGNRLDPREYANACAFRKGIGLNLKEKSSGKLQGRLTITKRGPSVGRRYLYFSALRLLRLDPYIKEWYQAKVKENGGKHKMKYVIALMRKVACALWYVGQGESFDARKLFSIKGVVAN